MAREEGCGGRVDRRAQRTGLSELGELRRERGRNHQKQEKDTIWLHFFITLAAEWKSTKEGPEGSRERCQEVVRQAERDDREERWCQSENT